MKPDPTETMILAKLDAKLPKGMACRVTFRGLVVEIPEPRDWTEVCNAARARVLPHVNLAIVDERHDAIMARRAAKLKSVGRDD